MHDAVVIGAGFAGLSAAAALSAHGKRVLVLEAKARLGGRATAFRDSATGELVDNGQHVLFGCYRETFRFLHRIGAASHVWLQPTLEVPIVDRDGRWSVLSCPPLPPPLHLLAGVIEWDALGLRDRLSVLRLVRPLRIARRSLEGKTRAAAAASDETVDEWLRMNGQTPRLREVLWEPLAVAALNQSPSDASAAPFVRVVAEMFGKRREDAAIAIPSRPLHLMYAEPARQFIEEAGGEVRTGCPARVIAKAGRVEAIEVPGGQLGAPAVVVAVPWFALAGAVAPEDGAAALADIVRAAAKMASCPIVTVNLWFDRPVLEVPFVGLPGRAMHWVFDKRLAFGEHASHLSLVASGAAGMVQWPNDDLIATATSEVLDTFPEARRAALTRATVIREPRATFSLAPGQPTRPPTTTPLPNLFLAGDWIDTGLPGTIESAVIAGHRAAAAALAMLG